jgi:hypothetical protein
VVVEGNEIEAVRLGMSVVGVVSFEEMDFLAARAVVLPELILARTYQWLT